MTLQALMHELAAQGVRLELIRDELKVTAAQGVMNDALKKRLKDHKAGVMALLKGAADASPRQEEVMARSRPQDGREPFPFSDLQTAFYMADNPCLEYHVRPHYYYEIDADGMDVTRYLDAVSKALHHHAGEAAMVADDRHLKPLPVLPQLNFPVHDLRDLDEAQAHERLSSMRQRMSRQPLPLDRWPWFDLQVSRWREQGRERTRIHANFNNFYTDGYGATVLQREIDAYYADPDLVLPPMEMTLRDAIVALDELARSPAGERARQYWLDRLPHLPGPPALPQLPLNKRVRSRLQRREGFLDAKSWTGFKRHAAACGLTPTGAIAATYAEILSAWSGSRHFVLSNMVTRRLPVHPDVMRLFGNFASLYPLEVDLRGDNTFAERALRLQQQMLRDAAHREWGGMQVMQAHNRLTGAQGTVPFPFVIGSGLFMEKYHKADFSCLETAQTVMDHQFWELDDDRFFHVWDLLEEFFPAGLIDAMWTAYADLLQRLASEPAAWQSREFQLAPAAERAPCTGNQDEAAPPDNGLLHDGQAHARPDHGTRIAVRSGTQALSHAQLDRWSLAIAGQLARRAVQPEELVAVAMDRGPGTVAAAVGILRAGAAYVPVEPTLPPERQHYMLDNARVRVVLTTAKYRDTLRWPAHLAIIAIDDEAQVPQDAPVPADAVRRADPGDLAYVIYTSGSTGKPKGVMIDHRGARNTILDINRRFGVTADDVVLGVSSFGFDLSVYDLFGALEAGATLVYPDAEAALNPAHWLDLMQRHEVTIWNSAPALAGLLVETAHRRQQSLPALRLVLLSGDWIPVELPAQIRQVAPNARVISLGGATEASIWSIWYDTAQLDPASPRIPYGKPLANQAWHIRDAQNRPTPFWTTGDLFISGVGLACGYWRDAEKTQAAFIHDAVTGRRLYRTGDRGRYLPDGNIEFLGRADTQVKIRGHRIELGEIESVLGAHPLVKECAVLVRSSGPADAAQLVQANTGPGALEIAAYVVPQADAASSAEHLVEQLRKAVLDSLPAYMEPASWAVLDQMPLSPNGKVDRRALAHIADVRPGGRSAATQAPPQPPRTETERLLARIWEQVLNHPVASARDDFFACGGQSIDAVRCLARIQEQFGKLLSLADIWQHRTLESLAGLLDAHDSEAPLSNLVSLAKRADGGTPWFMVHPGGGQCVGYHELAKRIDSPCYGLVAHAAEAGTGALSDVRHMARRYVDALLSVQKTGPHRLVGWSSGACVAHAMAAELESRGGRVSELVLIDCPAPVVHEALSEAALLRCFVEDLNLGLAASDLHFLDETGPDEPAGFGRAMQLLNERFGLQLEAEPLYQFFRVFRDVVSAVRAYRPDRIGANLSVLRAAKGQVTEFAGHPDAGAPHWGWSKLTRGAVRCGGIDGTHYTVLASPGVDKVAAWLNGLPETTSDASAEHAAVAAK